MANSPPTPAFPANVPALTEVKVDTVTDILAAHVNDIDDEVMAIAAVIGTGVGTNNPTTAAGGYANGTLHARLRALESVNISSIADGRITNLLGGAFSMGGAGGNRIDFDGDAALQARRVSDGAPVDMWLNWFSGGRVIAKDLYTNYLYNEGTVDALYLQSRGNINAAGNSYVAGAIEGGTLRAATNLTVTNGQGVFDSDHANDWTNAQVRAGAIAGAGNSVFSVWAAGTAALLKWYSGNGYWEFIHHTGDPGNGYNTIKVGGLINVSSRRFKHDIEDLPEELGLQVILNLRPVSFRLNSERDRTFVVSGEDEPEMSAGYLKDLETPHLGLIAEDTEPVLPHVIGYADEDASPESIDYQALVPSLIKGMQQQQAQIESLVARIEELEGEAGLIR